MRISAFFPGTLLATLILFLLLGAACAPAQSQNSGQTSDPSWRERPFTNPQRVTIEGYEGHAMEPFISRDGQVLFFNNRNEPAEQTDIHFATRVDDLTFTYAGRLAGAYEEETLDGVPTMDRDGNFYFVSLRSYGTRVQGETFSTIYTGRFDGTRVQGTELVTNISRDRAFWVNFDAEISADGGTLYTVEGLFRPILGGWRRANLALARRTSNGFRMDPDGERLFAAINTGAWEYAAAVSEDELELYFTRFTGFAPFGSFSTWVSRRENRTEPFGEPERVEAIRGMAEAVTIAPGGRALYYHKREHGTFSIFRVTR